MFTINAQNTRGNAEKIANMTATLGDLSKQHNIVILAVQASSRLLEAKQRNQLSHERMLLKAFRLLVEACVQPQKPRSCVLLLCAGSAVRGSCRVLVQVLD